MTDECCNTNFEYFRIMSLALLKRELEVASAELSTASGGKVKKAKSSGLGTERHGLKKKIHKQRAKKTVDKKFAFKFSEEIVKKKEDKTKDILNKLDMLDRIGKNVSAVKIVEDNDKKKRKAQMGEKESENNQSSILFTEEEIAALEKDCFIHSKANSRKPKNSVWDD